MPYADLEVRKRYQKRYSPEWQKANRPLLRKYNSTYRQKHREKMLWVAARRRAKQRGFPFDIEESDIIVPDRCPVLGIPIFFKDFSNKRNVSPNSPSIDRIVPALGYVKGNIQVISWRANNIKSNATAEELRLVADFVAKQRIG